jgi:addiction module HigA family antidote
MIKNMIYTNVTKNSLTTGRLLQQMTRPQIGNEVEYRGLTLQQFATKIGLTEEDMIDVLNDKRSYWPVDVIPEGSDLIPNNRLPYRPVHPGEMLKEEVEYRELNIAELAGQMGITDTELIEILNQKRPVTEDYAQRFEKTLELSAEWLRNIQAGYDIECVLIPMRNQWKLRKQQEKTANRQESKIGASQWQHRRQAVPNKQRVAVRTPATVGRELVPI